MEDHFTGIYAEPIYFATSEEEAGLGLGNSLIGVDGLVESYTKAY